MKLAVLPVRSEARSPIAAAGAVPTPPLEPPVDSPLGRSKERLERSQTHGLARRAPTESARSASSENGGVVGFLVAHLGGREPKKEHQEGPSTSALRELGPRLEQIGERMIYLGDRKPWRKVATNRLAMVLPALIADRRDLGEQEARFWVRRVSRESLIGRRGEISGPALDETLRSEAASFWVESDVSTKERQMLSEHPLSEQLAMILANKLLRFAEQKEQLFIEGSIRVLLWRQSRPYYLDVPLELIDQGPRALAGALARALEGTGLGNGPAHLPKSIALTPRAMAKLQGEAYGKYGDQDATVKTLLDADFAMVLDPQSLGRGGHFEGLFDPAKPWLTGGARMKEVSVFGVTRAENGRPVVASSATRNGHVWGDGLDALQHPNRDLCEFERLRLAPSEAGSELGFGLRLEGLDARKLHLRRAWKAALADGLPARTLPQEWGGIRSIPGETVGWLEPTKQRAGTSWVDRVTRLRQGVAERTGEPLKVTLPDLFAKAHALAGGTQSVHTLLSCEGERGRTLDIAFDVLPASISGAFEAFYRLCEAHGVKSAKDLSPDLWRAFQRAHAPFVASTAKRLVTGLRQYHQEKELAREGRSTAAYFSALAGHDKGIEQLFEKVSSLGVMIGPEITRAVAHPGGMVSNTAPSQGVSLDDVAPEKARTKSFYTAHSDSYRPRNARELTEERWAGVLGIGERPGQGLSLTLRLLPDQAWSEIAEAVRGLNLGAAKEAAALDAISQHALRRARDPLRLEEEMTASGLKEDAPAIIAAIDRSVQHRVDVQLLRTELAIEMLLRVLESKYIENA